MFSAEGGGSKVTFFTISLCGADHVWNNCNIFDFLLLLSEKVTAPLDLPTGQERFGNMTRVYYKEAVGAFVVFDVTRGSTFEAVSKWKHDLDSKVKLANGSPIPSVLLANKCDQKKESFNSKALMDNFCKETGFLGWFETSAKVRDWVDVQWSWDGRSVLSGMPETLRALMSLKSGASRRKRQFSWVTVTFQKGSAFFLTGVITAVTHRGLRNASVHVAKPFTLFF